MCYTGDEPCSACVYFRQSGQMLVGLVHAVILPRAECPSSKRDQRAQTMQSNAMGFSVYVLLAYWDDCPILSEDSFTGFSDCAEW